VRPSQAAAIEEADLIVWVGEELSPWLEKAIDSIAQNPEQIRLLEVKGTRLFDFREEVEFEEEEAYRAAGKHDDHDDHDDHGHDDHGHDDHGMEDDDHDDHGHDDHDDHDDHGDDHHGHDHDGVDPHAWLDPDNARLWLRHIADKLASMDPANAAGPKSRRSPGWRPCAASRSSSITTHIIISSVRLT